ncbi:MAG: hypothetical protein HY721_22035 [Planctomycetes bacterium]|nr:hypothetical protein [Planctomycetota bacterium]
MQRPSRRACGRVLLLFLLSLGLAACSGDEPSKGKRKPKGSSDDSGEEDASSGEALGDLQTEVEELIAKVEKAGAKKTHKDELEAIQEQLAAAVTAIEDGENAKASKKLKLVQKRAKAIAAEQAAALDSIKKLEPLKKSAEDARKKAEAAKAAQNAPGLWKEAQEAYQKGVEALKAPSAASAEVARSSLGLAKDIFTTAAEQAAQNAKLLVQVEEEKTVMLSMKEKAKARGAEEKAIETWNLAGSTEREAANEVEAGNLMQAKELYKMATGRYIDALGQVQSAADQEKLIEELKKSAATEELARKAEEERLKRQKEQEEAEAKEEEGEKAKGGSPTVAPPPPGGAGPVASLPEGMEAQNYPQELDAEDEAFLREHYKKLTPSGQIEYDHGTGFVSIDYTEGKHVQKDVQIVTLPRKEHLIFKPPDQPTRGGGALSPEDQKKMAPFSFEGNTVGLIVFPVPFRYYVRVEWYTQIRTMDNNADFNVHVMFDPKKRAGYMTNWVKIGTSTKGAVPMRGTPPKFLKPANEWFDKQKAIPMLVEYRMPDPEKTEGGPLGSGLLTNVYFNDDSETELDTRLTTKFPSKTYQRGLVGFGWSRAKAAVMDLRLTGILDKEAAVEILRAKLKKPKAKPTGEKKPAKPKETKEKAEKPEGEGGGEAPAPVPTAAGGPNGAGGGAKKKEGAGGGLDF